SLRHQVARRSGPTRRHALGSRGPSRGRARVRAREPAQRGGDQLALAVPRRDGRQPLARARRGAPSRQRRPGRPRAVACHGLAGATGGTLAPALAEELRLDSAAQGVAVLSLADGSPAQNLGFQKGDVVLQVNGTRITTTADLQKAVTQQSRLWRITILRDGQQ